MSRPYRSYSTEFKLQWFTPTSTAREASRRLQGSTASATRLRATGVPITDGCGVMGISRSTSYAVPQDSTSSALKRESDAALRGAIEHVVTEWSAYARCGSAHHVTDHANCSLSFSVDCRFEAMLVVDELKRLIVSYRVVRLVQSERTCCSR